MTVDYTAAKGAPRLIPSLSTPSFAADILEIVQWLQKGRSFRRAATQAALELLIGMEDNDLGTVDTIDGAFFKYDSATSKWKMIGEPSFATSTARNAAITAPQAGMVTRVDTDLFPRRYNGTSWLPWGAGIFPIKPASVSAAGGAATLGADGQILLAAATSLIMPNLWSDDFDAYMGEWDFSSTGGSADLIVCQRAAGVDVVTGYRNRGAESGTAIASPITTGHQVGRVGAGGGSGSFIMQAPKLARVTRWNGMSFDADIFQRSAGGDLNNTTSYTDATMKLGPAGQMTGEVRWYGLNKGA